MDGKKFFLFYNNMKGNTVDVTQYTSRDEEVIRKGHQRRELLCGMDDPAAYILPALLYFWQLPHFMSLAWMVKYDLQEVAHLTCLLNHIVLFILLLLTFDLHTLETIYNFGNDTEMTTPWAAIACFR